jgi:hypothetical protein
LVWRWWLAEVNDVECSVIILWFEGSWAVHDVVDDWTRWRMKLCFSFLLCFCLCFSPLFSLHETSYIYMHQSSLRESSSNKLWDIFQHVGTISFCFRDKAKCLCDVSFSFAFCLVTHCSCPFWREIICYTLP